MAWLSGSLNDSFNSIKGQITKITKEVLESDDTEESQSLEDQIKELKALCDCQSIEIASLREENLQQQKKAEIKVTTEQTRKLSGSSSRNFDFTDDQLQHICELEDELRQIKEENKCLQTSLNDLDLDHEKEMMEVVKVKEKLKLEMEKLNMEHQILLSEYKKYERNPDDIWQDESEVEKLKAEVSDLESQLELMKNEKEESYETIKNEIIEHESIKGKLEKLVNEIKGLNEEKFKVEQENKKLKCDIDENSKLLEIVEVEKQNLQVKVNETEVLLKQMGDQLKSFATRKGCDLPNEAETSSLLDALILFLDKEVAQFEDRNVEEVQHLNEKITVLKEENLKLETNAKTSQKAWTEIEEGQKKLIESLQRKCVELESQQTASAMQGKTDDVKRLEQEALSLKEKLSKSNDQVREANKLQGQTEAELKILKSMTTKVEKELLALHKEKEELTVEVKLWKGAVEDKEALLTNCIQEKELLELKISNLEAQVGHLQKIQKDLEKELYDTQQKAKIVQDELTSLKEKLSDMSQQATADLQNSITNVQELMEKVTHLERVNNELVIENERLKQEDASKDQSQETDELKQQLSMYIGRDEQMQASYNSLVEVYNRVYYELEELKSKKNTEVQETENLQHHKRSKSAVELADTDINLSKELEKYKSIVEEQKFMATRMQKDNDELKKRIASLENNLTRLQEHLSQSDQHNDVELAESHKKLNEYKVNLTKAEDQVDNFKKMYKSAKVREQQHVESLASQINLITLQRDDLQEKLSLAEDKIEKHNAALTSLHIVLEQFQQDKEREIQSLVMKYEYQLQLSQKRFTELELEIDSLRKQLEDAKEGLKAAARLGEQLEVKSNTVTLLEATVKELKKHVADVERAMSQVSQTNAGKVEKSLIKNFVVGYITTSQADRRLEILRVLSSVLDFDQEERSRTGVEGQHPGWLTNWLHPRADSLPGNQSLSEAFIHFLENESRPQPKVKFLPEHTRLEKPSPHPIMEDLRLPTFGSTVTGSSSSILKDVLKDS